MDQDPHDTKNDVFIDSKGSTPLLNRRDKNDVSDVVFPNVVQFSSSYDNDLSNSIRDKKVRFADAIAADMEAASWLTPHGHWDVPSASEQRDCTNCLAVVDMLEQETTWVDQGEDVSSQISEESVNEDTRMRRQLWYAVSGAGVMTLLGWTVGKILQLFQKRVDEEDDDRVGGGDMWGNNPIADQLQIKEAAKGMIVNQGNKSSPSHSVSGLCVAAAESGSFHHAVVQQ